MSTASSLVLLALAALCGSTVSVPIVIPLDKQYVPVQKKNATVVAYKTAYFGNVLLGKPEPQNFTVVFDTGSGHFFLPSSKCQAETCRLHRRYRRWASGSAVDVDANGVIMEGSWTERDQVSIVYGTGEVVGDFVRETVCLQDPRSVVGAGAEVCTDVRVVLATEMTDEPFGTFEFDGVLGLGLDSLAVDPEFSFFGQMAKSYSASEASFGYFLSRSDDVPSEISFGGIDTRRLAADIQWTPVHQPELGYWQVRLRSVRVGEKVLNVCDDGTCVAIADTGTSLLGVPKQSMQALHVALARKVPGDPSELDCRDFEGPELTFDLGDVQLTLGPEDYSRSQAMRVVHTQSNRSQVICRASLMPLESGEASLNRKTWILGEPVLRKYYTAYDWHRRSVGFAPSLQPTEPYMPNGETGHQHAVIGAPPLEAPAPAVVIV